MQLDHRVIIDVNDVRGRMYLFDHFMGVADSGEARADIDELAYPLAGDPRCGPLMIAAVRPGGIPDLRNRANDPLGRDFAPGRRHPGDRGLQGG